MTKVIRKVMGVRLPVGLIAAVKGEAVSRGVTVEMFVEGALRGALEGRVSRAAPTSAVESSPLEALMREGRIGFGMPKGREPWRPRDEQDQTRDESED